VMHKHHAVGCCVEGGCVELYNAIDWHLQSTEKFGDKHYFNQNMFLAFYSYVVTHNELALLVDCKLHNATTNTVLLSPSNLMLTYIINSDGVKDMTHEAKAMMTRKAKANAKDVTCHAALKPQTLYTVQC